MTAEVLLLQGIVRGLLMGLVYALIAAGQSSLADYVTVTGTTDRAPAAGGC